MHSMYGWKGIHIHSECGWKVNTHNLKIYTPIQFLVYNLSLDDKFADVKLM